MSSTEDRSGLFVTIGISGTGTAVSEFFKAIAEHPFMFNAVLTGLLASVACGVVGTYVVARRITYLAGGIAHSVLGGMGVAYYLSQVHHLEYIRPMHGAIAAGLLAAVIIGLVSLRAKQREDTAIGALWAAGMAVGIVFITRTPGYNQDLMSYLFGNILLVSGRDLWLLGGLDVLVVGVSIVFYNQFLAVCFDDEFARVRGINVEFFYLLLLCLTALTVVILASVVGIILVIALLTIPAATVGHFTRTLWQTMLLAIACGVLFNIAGLGISYQPDLPAGATIILLAATVYLAVALTYRFLRLRRPK